MRHGVQFQDKQSISLHPHSKFLNLWVKSADGSRWSLATWLFSKPKTQIICHCHHGGISSKCNGFPIGSVPSAELPTLLPRRGIGIPKTDIPHGVRRLRWSRSEVIPGCSSYPSVNGLPLNQRATILTWITTLGRCSGFTLLSRYPLPCFYRAALCFVSALFSLYVPHALLYFSSVTCVARCIIQAILSMFQDEPERARRWEEAFST